MSERYTRIAANDQVKKKVALIRKQMFMTESIYYDNLVMKDQKD